MKNTAFSKNLRFPVFYNEDITAAFQIQIIDTFSNLLSYPTESERCSSDVNSEFWKGLCYRFHRELKYFENILKFR